MKNIPRPNVSADDPPLTASRLGLFAYPQPKRHVLLSGGTDSPDAATSTPLHQTQSSTPDAIGGGIGPTDGVEGCNAAGAEARGVYVCALGGLPIFLSEDELTPAGASKRSNWPGFRCAVHPEHVVRDE